MFYEISFQFALLLLTFILYQIKVKSFPELLPAPEVESVCCFFPELSSFRGQLFFCPSFPQLRRFFPPL